MFEIGQHVRIKEWDEMVREFGLNESGDISCPCVFNTQMRQFCGKVYRVSGSRQIYGGITVYTFVEPDMISWTVSEQMLELVDVRGLRQVIM